MNFNRYKAITKKEFKHLLRDYRLLAILIFFPVFLLWIFGYAINFDVKNIQTAILDYDHSELSKEYAKSISNTEYFKVINNPKGEKEIKPILDKKIAQLVIVIPKNFSKDFYSAQNVKIQYLIDGVDGNTANIIQNYANISAASFSGKISSEILSSKGIKLSSPIDFQPRFWYNPELNSTLFLIPGLIAMILMIASAVSVSLSFVREKEKGTIEQVYVSPVKSSELILGKTTPYLILAMINAIMILIAGYFFFGVVIKGNYLLLFLTTSLFLLASTSIGILVSVISDSLQVAFTLSTFATLLPSLILSGFIFPIESMPWIIQIFTNITPAKFYITILRAIILRGVGIEAFYWEVIILTIFSIVLLSISNLIYHKTEQAV